MNPERELDSSKLHVGLCSPALPYREVSNGIVTYVRAMRDALRSLGHLVTIVDGVQIEHADGTIADLPRPQGLSSRLQTLAESWRGRDRSLAYIRLRTIKGFHALRAAGADVVEIEETCGWASRIVGHNVPIVMRLHGPHALGRETVERTQADRRREAAEIDAFARVDAVSSPSRGLLDAMARLGGHARLNRVILNPMPLPCERWSLERADPDQILCVGRFDLRKGADIVLRAFCRALETRPSLKLVMVGADRGLGGTVRFAEFIRSIPVEARNRIEFLGEQGPESVAKLRLRSAFAIVGSRFETFSYAAFEAQALGMPVLATRTFGPGEIITDRFDGRLVPVADVEAMAEAIVEMATDQAGLADMGAAARATVAAKMAPRLIAAESVELYRQVARGVPRNG